MVRGLDSETSNEGWYNHIYHTIIDLDNQSSFNTYAILINLKLKPILEAKRLISKPLLGLASS